MNDRSSYSGYEIGPIRPPSESNSLLIRISRNCPWNNCTFCGLYKGERFSLRSVQDVKADIKELKSWSDYFQNSPASPVKAPGNLSSYAAVVVEPWVRGGQRSIFLQDANSLVMKPEHLVEVLTFLKKSFPSTQRITTYGRSHTIARISDEDMISLAEAGLNRIHIGLESGCDKVLDLVKKGVDKDTHILAGQRVKRAGIELSEYYMPGLGGTEYAECNATETADALNKINPDFIRIRTLAIPKGIPLEADYEAGVFSRSNDVDMVKELLLMVEHLEGITSTLKNDHILNLLPEMKGDFPQDKNEMIKIMKTFLSLSESDQIIFRVGRRTGRMTRLSSLTDNEKRTLVEKIIEDNEITDSNIDGICDNLMRRFI